MWARHAPCYRLFLGCDRDAAGNSLEGGYTWSGGGEKDIRRRDQFFGVAAAKIGIVPGEALNVAAVSPTELLQYLHKCR
jgi:hypothetical protein